MAESSQETAGASHRGRLAGRIALVTGASRGIGRAVALRFAEEGAQLIAVARTSAALEELDDEVQANGGSRPTLVPMDMMDYPAIDRLGAALYERHGKLDVLVGNAGVLGTLSPLGHIKPETWDEVMGINVTANWRLLRSLDPLLRQSDAGRVVMVTSTVGAEPRAYWGVYGVSKAALENLTLTYAAEVAKTNVRVNLINPGATRTRMRAAAYPGENPDDVKPPEAVTDVFLELALSECERHGERVTVG